MQYIDAVEGRTIVLNGTRYLNFSGTSYLAINSEAAFQQSLSEGMQKYGSNFGGSRLSNTRFEVFEKAEAYLCQLTGAETAFTLSSGMLAGQMVQQLIPKKYVKHYEKDTHPALWGKHSALSNLDYPDWIDKTLELANTTPHLAIFCNSVDPLRATPYDFTWISDLPKHQSIMLLIDDSHGLGVMGKNGGGILTMLPPHDHLTTVVVGSLGKALGVPGGVVLSSQKWFKQLKTSYFYGGASPIVPAYLYAFLQTSTLRHTLLQRLRSNIQYFSDALQQHGITDWQYLEDYPVFYTPLTAVYQVLLANHILISSFPYPKPTDPIITRVVLNAAHTNEDIDTLMTQLLKLYAL